MRILLAALPSVVGAEERNLAGLDAVMREHAGRAELVVVAEAFGQGFDAVEDDPERDLAIAWDQDGPEIGRVRAWARRDHMAVCMGFMERNGDAIHSSAVVLAPDGNTVALYRRISRGWRLPTTDAHPDVYVDGTEVVTFTMHGKRCAVALCGDLWDVPERIAAARADVLLWPMFRTGNQEEWNTTEIHEYAQRAAGVSPEAILVGSLAPSDANPDELAWGGAAWLSGGTVREFIPMGQQGTRLVEIP